MGGLGGDGREARKGEMGDGGERKVSDGMAAVVWVRRGRAGWRVMVGKKKNTAVSM